MRHRVPNRRQVLSYLRPAPPSNQGVDQRTSAHRRAMGGSPKPAPAMAGSGLIVPQNLIASVAAISSLSRDQAPGGSADRIADRILHRSRLRRRSTLCELLLQGVESCGVSGDPDVAGGMAVGCYCCLCGRHSTEDSIWRAQRQRIEDCGSSRNLHTSSRSTPGSVSNPAGTALLMHSVEMVNRAGAAT
jgi:hypothetical protein